MDTLDSFVGAQARTGAADAEESLAGALSDLKATQVDGQHLSQLPASLAPLNLTQHKA